MKLSSIFKRESHISGVDPKRAYEIMGHNFIGMQDAINLCQKNIYKFEIQRLQMIPSTEAFLEARRDTHILVFDLGLSIRNIWSIFHEFFSKCSYHNYKLPYPYAPFVNNKACFPVWRLVRKEPVINTNSIINEAIATEQLFRLNGEHVPVPRTMVYTIILYYLLSDKWLLYNKGAISVGARCFGISSNLNGARHGINIAVISDDSMGATDGLTFDTCGLVSDLAAETIL